MKRSRVSIFVAAIVLAAAVLACGGSVSTANIKDAWMSTDDAGQNRTSTYGPGDVFYAQVDLKNAPDDTKLKAVWTAVSAEGVDANTQIEEKEFTSGDALVTFNLSNNGPWPLGQYKVDVYLNDGLSKTLPFEVK